MSVPQVPPYLPICLPVCLSEQAPLSLPLSSKYCLFFFPLPGGTVVSMVTRCRFVTKPYLAPAVEIGSICLYLALCPRPQLEGVLTRSC